MHAVLTYIALEARVYLRFGFLFLFFSPFLSSRFGFSPCACVRVDVDFIVRLYVCVCVHA